MILRQLFDPDSSSFTYVIGDEQSREAAVVDSVLERVDEVLAALEQEGLRLTWILETHVHADHVTGGSLLRERTGASIAVSALANECGCAERSLQQGDEIRVGTVRIRVLPTPGHTADSVSYLVDDQLVLTGDALLIGTCGRTDFQGGDAGTLYDSIHRQLFTLPEAVTIYPGHDYKGLRSSTIGAERRSNARAAGRTRESFIELMNGLHLPMPRRLDEAVPANLHCGIGAVSHAAGH